MVSERVVVLLCEVVVLVLEDESVDVVVDLVFVFEEELVVVVEPVLCVVVVDDGEELVDVALELVEKDVVVVVTVVVDTEIDEDEVVFVFALVLVAIVPDKFLRFADVYAKAITTTTIPITSTVADLFNFA